MIDISEYPNIIVKSILIVNHNYPVNTTHTICTLYEITNRLYILLYKTVRIKSIPKTKKITNTILRPSN